MRNLLIFILKYSHLLIFIGLQLICVALLVNFNSYQGSVWYTSSSRLMGSVSEVTAVVKRYFGLEEANKALTKRNILLVEQVEHYKQLLEEKMGAESLPKLVVKDEMDASVATGNLGTTSSAALSVKRDKQAVDRSVIPDSLFVCAARVVNNTVHRMDNYITIDRGEEDGVRTGMGVVSGVGVVGIVYRTSGNYSLVLPLLNSKSSISCKLARTDYFGFLQWKGGDPLEILLTDVPRHAEFALGDTVVTSGHSTVFIEGIPVGTVDSHSESHDRLSFTLGVHLFTDLARLNDVFVMALPPDSEREELEKDIKF